MLPTIITLALFLSAEAPKEREQELTVTAKNDLKNLQGFWKAIKNVRNGQEEENPTMGTADMVIEFRGRTLMFLDREFVTIAALDAGGDPKGIDFKSLVAVGPVTKGMVFEGIYKLDGDTLVLAFNAEGGTSRPTKFESPKGSQVTVVTFKREKK